MHIIIVDLEIFAHPVCVDIWAHPQDPLAHRCKTIKSQLLQASEKHIGDFNMVAEKWSRDRSSASGVSFRNNNKQQQSHSR
jgi:hypothetical protein